MGCVEPLGKAFINHGSSIARTITSAVLRAKQFHDSGCNDAITQRLGAMEEIPA